MVSTINFSALSWKDFLRNETRLRVPHRKLEQFLRFLEFDPKQFFKLVNEGIKACVKPGIKATLDESIWSWLGSHPGVLHIDRKPNIDGSQVFMLVFELTQTKRYVT